MVNQLTPAGEPLILDVQFGFTPDEAYATLASVFGIIKWGVITLSIGVVICAITGWVIQMRKSDYQQENQFP